MGDKPFKCNTCHETFRCLSHLNTHKCTHTSETRSLYTCETCHIGFNKLSSLDTHKQLIHTVDRLYKCDTCNMSFSHFVNFNRHRTIHTGESRTNVTD